MLEGELSFWWHSHHFEGHHWSPITVWTLNDIHNETKTQDCFQEFALETFKTRKAGSEITRLSAPNIEPSMTSRWSQEHRLCRSISMSVNVIFTCWPWGAVNVQVHSVYLPEEVFILREIATTICQFKFCKPVLGVWIPTPLPVVVFRVVWSGNGHCFSIQSICPSATWLAPASLTWLKIKDLEQVSLALELYHSPVAVASAAMKIPTTSFISKTFFGQGRPTIEKNDVVTWRQLWDTSSMSHGKDDRNTWV